jgi:disulfide bond formation protein DsbB
VLSSLKARCLSVDWIRSATTLVLPVLRRWPLWAALISAAMLATAHAFETFGGLAPCHLCLQQREVYWTALAVGLAGTVLSRVKWTVRARITVLLLLTAIFLYSAGLAAFHAGVEWKWWPGPATCTGGAGRITAADLAASLGGEAKLGPPACDVAAWRMLGLSMAGWNVLVSLGLAKLSALAAARAIVRKGVEA